MISKTANAASLLPHLLECFFAVEEDLFALYRPEKGERAWTS